MGRHVLWSLSAAGSEVDTLRFPLSLGPFDLAFGELPGNPSGDITARGRRAQRIDGVAGGRPGLIDSGGLGRGAVKGGGETVEGIMGVLVGEVGALLIGWFGFGEVEGVVLPASAHRHISPFPIGSPVNDYEGPVGGDALVLVSGHRIPVVDMALLEIPDRQLPGFGVTIQSNRQTLGFLVDAGNGGEVTVEHAKPTLFNAAQGPQSDLEQRAGFDPPWLSS